MVEEAYTGAIDRATGWFKGIGKGRKRGPYETV